MKLLRLIVPVVLAFLCVAFSSPTAPQKIGSKYRLFPNLGVEFKPLKGLSDVPINTGWGDNGTIAQFKVAQPEYIKSEEGERVPMKDLGCDVLYVKSEGPTTGGKKEVTREKDSRNSATDFLKSLRGRDVKNAELKPEVSEVKLAKVVEAQRSIFTVERKVPFNTGEVFTLPFVYDIYILPIDGGKMVFLWEYPGDKKARKKWASAVKKSMRSFRFSRKEATSTDVKDVNSESSYEDLLEFHRNNVAQTPGWRLVETPSKQYLIKTNSDDDKDLDLVIKRLEASRELFEKDFPPQVPITSISVVRVCDSEEVFHTYGNTNPGTAGWFNPRSEELVLYFGESGKDFTLSVMAHEAFHQYCHFLFDRAKAHRWFDEGHGDYYGAWTMKGKRLKQEEDMKGGLARLPELKQLFREETLKPLADHIRFTHPEWQGQGPSNVSCYAQSYGLIRFLRMGSLGKVKRTYWDKSYKDIIPNYMGALHKGFQDAYEEIREEARKRLDKHMELDPEDHDPDRIAELEKRLETPWDYVGSKGPDIREAAMEASWGKVDEDEFEKKWLAWIDKAL